MRNPTKMRHVLRYRSHGARLQRENHRFRESLYSERMSDRPKYFSTDEVSAAPFQIEFC
jgi:hypothetical protein